MPAAEDKSDDTPNGWEAVFKLGQDLVGGLRKTFEPLSLLMNSSTPTGKPSGSSDQTSNGSSPTPSGTDETPTSSSSSSLWGSDSWESLNVSHVQKEHEGTLVIHLSAYGSDIQVRKGVQNLLLDLNVKGYNVISSTYNGDPIEAAPKR